MTTVARAVGGFRRASTLPFALAFSCLVGFSSLAALAHVRTPDFSRLDRTVDSVLPEQDSRSRFDYRGEPKDVPAVAGQVCGFSRGTDQSSTDAILAAGVFGAPPISEVGLQSMRAGRAGTQEILSLFEAIPAASDVVRVAQGATPDGAPCPLYVSIGAEGAAAQTFWRFAPDDEPAGWFDEDGRRLGAALALPRPGSRLSSPFGPRRYYGRPSGGGFHDGIDYEARVGQPILAAADGIVEHRGTHFEYGLTVKIRHAAQFTTLYAHMSRFAADLAVGSHVGKGDVIGYVGMTGRSTGAHLHFSTIINGKFSDPAPYLEGDRVLKARTLAGFRKWQDDVRAAVQQVRDRQRRNPVQDDDWTSRM
jgi:murein DD-endopeptidase MepM/ murein hydrolase activator NlpD